MRYLITGGCGFLGANLAEETIRRGDELIVMDNLSRQGAAENLHWLQSLGKFSFHSSDVRCAEDVQHVVRSTTPDVIFHLAGQVAMTTSIERPAYDFQINVGGTVNVLEAVRNTAPDCTVVFSSTNKVYGDLDEFEYEESATRYECIDHPRGFDESTPLNFHSPYGCSKGAADQYCLDYARIYGLKTVVFRHSSMYGGRQFATFDQGWIGWFCQQALETRDNAGKPPFTISGNGKQVRDVLHVSDAVQCYLAAAGNIERAAGESFNIGGGIENSLSLLELFAALEEELSVRLSYTQLPPRCSDQKFFVADTSKAKRLLGWTSRTPARDGLRAMLNWLDTGNLHDRRVA